MREILFTFLSIACALLIFNQVECTTKKISGVLLECWPTQRYSQINFNMNVYISSRKKLDQSTIEATDFDPRRKTTVIVHGLGGKPSDGVIVHLKKQLLRLEDMNVVVLDWQKGSNNPLLYPQAVINTRTAAEYLVNIFSLTVDLWKSKGVELKDWAPIHLIGHSLGAHVVGQTGRYLRKKNLLVDRITVLDPAEPCFENPKFPLRLRKTDANFVDVIHTDSAVEVRNSALGLYEPVGHVDFYPNGGRWQPGCYRPQTARRKRELNLVGIIAHMIEGNCSHMRSILLFIESVKQKRLNHCKFWARPWKLGGKIPENTPCTEDTCQQLGINAKRPASNESTIYYVETTANSPYCNI